ncbi:MAG: peptide-N-glycosidase F-related protein [Salinivirgaceae bacterium]|nr:peptide-N-glycosidase F-related protein [Salinivirgaceae bacterium]
MKKRKLFIALLGLFVLTSNLQAQNYALDFDGINDKVGILDNATLNPTEAMTLEIWINAKQWAGSIWGACLISKQGTNPDKGYALTVGENGRIEFNHSINESWKAVQTTPILGLNSWYHIAAVYDGSSMKIYVNGIVQSSIDAIGSLTLGTGVVMNLGDNPTWPGRFFNGAMDEIRIWNVARNEMEIRDNMTIELAGNEPGLVAYWNMNEGTGTVLTDATDNANNGTLLNFGDNPWVEGFTPPGADLGVLGIASPSVIGVGFTAEEYIKLDVKNFSTSDVSEFEMAYQINNGEIVTCTVNESLSAFSTGVFAFPNSVDLSSFDEVALKTWVTIADDGNAANDTLISTITQTNTFVLYNGVQHNFGSAGQTHFNTVYMPEDLSKYSQITLSLDLRCPSGGCDPWDQPGMLYIQKDGLAFEIMRYVTPYGKACGGWIYDLTDFKPLLQGKAVFESIIRVWGASGWLVDMTFEFTEGEPPYFVTKLDPLWNTDYWVYGDPGISYDFPEVTLPVLPETDAAKVRMTVSGHGQANTNNAAEFSEFTHHLWVDGAETFPMHLWKADCNVNPCSPQSGTWQYARAGWCPGQDIQPWEFNLQDHFTAGQDIDLDFVLADYTNLLNTGYNNGSHTEPFYRVHAYLVQYTRNPNVMIDGFQGEGNPNAVRVYPNPTNGNIRVCVTEQNIQSVTVFGLDGRVEKSLSFGGENNVSVDLSELSNGVYFIEVRTNSETTVSKVVKK